MIRRLLCPEVIGPPDCPILHRWTLGGDRLMRRAPIKVLLHHFLPDADDRDVHDHPRPFVTVVLRGGYDDLMPCPVCDGRSTWKKPKVGPGWAGHFEGGWCEACNRTGVVLREWMRAGTVRYRPAEHAHRTKVHSDGCWTLVVMGPIRRPWGFWREGKWWAYKDYERTFGLSFRCEDTDD